MSTADGRKVLGTTRLSFARECRPLPAHFNQAAAWVKSTIS